MFPQVPRPWKSHLFNNILILNCNPYILRRPGIGNLIYPILYHSKISLHISASGQALVDFHLASQEYCLNRQAPLFPVLQRLGHVKRGFPRSDPHRRPPVEYSILGRVRDRSFIMRRGGTKRGRQVSFTPTKRGRDFCHADFNTGA